MLLCSLLVMFLGLVFLTASLSASSLTTLALIGISIYYVGFSIGVGPVCWLYASEIYPTRLRPVLMSLCTVANRICGTVVASTVTTAEGVTGAQGYYGVLAGITAASAVGVWGLVVETKGVELEDMRRVFGAGLGERERRGGARVVDGYGETEGEGIGGIEMEVVGDSGVAKEGRKGRIGRVMDKVLLKGKTKRKRGKKYGRLGDEDEDENEDGEKGGQIDEDDLSDI